MGRGVIGRRVRVKGKRGTWVVKKVHVIAAHGAQGVVLTKPGEPGRKLYAFRDEIKFIKGDYEVKPGPRDVVVRSSRGL